MGGCEPSDRSSSLPRRCRVRGCADSSGFGADWYSMQPGGTPGQRRRSAHRRRPRPPGGRGAAAVGVPTGDRRVAAGRVAGGRVAASPADPGRGRGDRGPGDRRRRRPRRHASDRRRLVGHRDAELGRPAASPLVVDGQVWASIDVPQSVAGATRTRGRELECARPRLGYGDGAADTRERTTDQRSTRNRATAVT